MYTVEADMHTHTVQSHDGYSTLMENIEAAKRKHLKAIAMTDYGPEYNNSNTKRDLMSQSFYIPDEIEGIRIYKGIEINIMDIHTGVMDITDEEASKFDWTIAAYNKGTEYDSRFITAAIVERTLMDVLRRPGIMMIGHPERFLPTFDFDDFVAECRNNGKLVELNTWSLRNPDYGKNAKNLMEECKKQRCPICINSDAHIASRVGDFADAFSLLSSIDFPQELIINKNLESVQSYIDSFKRLRESRMAKQNLPRTLERFKPMNRA